MVKIIGPFQINTTGTRTTEEVFAAGKYDGKNNMVNGKNFPIRTMFKGTREIVLVEFDRDTSSEEVLAEAKRWGLKRPRCEDALFFGEQHPEEQCTAPILFLRKPAWWRACVRLFVLVLRCDGGRRTLCLNPFDGGWHQRCRFAFVRP
ncbi:hypothetical protein A2524_04565 [Candidatus Wolfebacteria bacterium RIFOXYD12_FULL_48_21]|uniref:Uncharacterized protein n=1 Tax=Candidatus Wolfebacteria bacterium RIFOXYD1_FULL_48_65 TaxID=1802561 RepID=A0A1F8E469_9BACT|nr:MAG: hypothetical protein A2524_04565 [Candidatus Wolfebacteria bacterium RIFOXYD12_FULL_48_21]OGM95651.1 MAG: hypothetical protein A2610_02415 [Candidatus Wolfebacteria bacterium RIFOXYD1_FULL_48_65]OGM96752.1 MAG: hypothetical protein A2532_04170 [Candidatus Wolfebacteria bacterium RIFOXYD2_FULL_48_11]